MTWISAVLAASRHLFDVDQIEVFRGPQGTRYGANALAGLIYMQSVDPGEALSGSGQRDRRR